MNWFRMVLAATFLVAAASQASAQRGGAGAWELLGEEKVGLGADHDVINLRHNEDFYRNKAYRKLRFVVSKGELRLRTIRLVYINGHAEDFSYEQRLRAGQQIELDLRGEKSYLQRIEMFYRSRPSFSFGPGGISFGGATVQVYGENVRFGGPPPPGPGPGPGAGPWRPQGHWVPLGETSVGFQAEREVLRIRQPESFYRDRGFDKLHFYAENNNVHLMRLRIVYMNGHAEDVRVDRLVQAGTSFDLDLPGRRSYLREIEMIYRKQPGMRGRAIVKVFGETAGRR